MKSCDEMVNSLLRRRDAHAARQKRKRKAAAGIISGLCCCALVAFAGFWVRDRGMLDVSPDVDETITPESTASENRTPEYTDPALPDDVTTGIANGEMSDDSGWLEWNGKNISLALWDALEDEAENGELAIQAHPLREDEEFVYNGKTLAEYLEERDAEYMQPEKLAELLKLGEALKYGEALYQTGTPDGEKWAQSLYEDTVAYFGQEMLEKYIVDGVFLADQVEADMQAAWESTAAEDAYMQALDAYLAAMIAEKKEELDSLGIEYDRETDNRLIVYATAEEFAALSFEDMEDWIFSLVQDPDPDYDPDAPQDDGAETSAQ